MPGGRSTRPENVWFDQSGDLTARDQLADVLRLRLRERTRAAIVLLEEDLARAVAAPERTVVAVRIDAAPEDALVGLREAVAGRRADREAAVLAPVLVDVRRGR